MSADNSTAERNLPLDKNLLRYIWRHTKSDQAWVLTIILLSMPTYFMVFDLPKQIINRPIQGEGFESATDTANFMQIDIGLPSWLFGGGSFEIFSGFDLERIDYLVALSLTFLALVCINGLFKFYINTYKGRLGERMLRRIRYQLVDRVLRFPMGQFRRVKGSEIASMVKDEVEPFGEFIGDAIVQPFFLGGQALIAFTFIFIQNVWLGLLTMVTITIQVGIIPVLRRRVLELGRQRQITARQLSGRIGEIVDGITAVHVNDTSNYERAEVTSRLGRIFNIRYELFQRKFFVKFVSNFLAQFTPFLFYMIGGYFAIRGTLDIGQLIAAIAAYKELPSPINGLIMWDQKRVDINIKYGQIVEHFNIDDMTDAEVQSPTKETIPPLQGPIEIAKLGVVDETGSELLDSVSLTLGMHEIVAAVGPPNSGVETLPAILARLQDPTSGRVLIDGKSIDDFQESITGRRFGYIGPDSFLPQETLGNTLLYPLKRVPILEPELDAATVAFRNRNLREARTAGNIDLDLHSDWIDYAAAGVTGPEEVYERLLEVLQVVELDDMVYELALRQALDPNENAELCAEIVSARSTFRTRLEKLDLAQYVDPFDRDAYNGQATVAENILFGTVSDDLLGVENLVKDEHMRRVLADTGLDRFLFDMGIELAETAIELFADLSPDNPFFEQLNFMSSDEMEEYPQILSRIARGEFDKANEMARQKLLLLSFRYTEPRNRLGLLKEGEEKQILKARQQFQADLPESLRNKINFYDKDTYNAVSSIQDNILLGRIAYGYSEVTEQVQKEIHLMLEELGLKDDIFRAGLSFNIGSAGKRLTEPQRQKIALARTLLKQPDLLIVNKGLNSLDGRTQERLVGKIVELARGAQGRPPFGLFWALMTPSLAEKFDRVVVFENGAIVEDGVPKDVAEANGAFAALVS